MQPLKSPRAPLCWGRGGAERARPLHRPPSGLPRPLSHGDGRGEVSPHSSGITASDLRPQCPFSVRIWSVCPSWGLSVDGGLPVPCPGWWGQRSRWAHTGGVSALLPPRWEALPAPRTPPRSPTSSCQACLGCGWNLNRRAVIRLGPCLPPGPSCPRPRSLPALDRPRERTFICSASCIYWLWRC